MAKGQASPEAAGQLGTLKISATLDALIDDRRFILVNPMDHWATPGWNGTKCHIPPRDEVWEAEAKGDYESYKDPATGKYVPGTLCIMDGYVDGPLGPEKSFDCVRFIRESLGITKNKKTGKVTFEKDWGAAGVSVVIDGASREEIEQVRAGGNERWQEHELAVAQMHVHAFESQNQARTRSGMTPLTESPEIVAYRELVSHFDSKRKQKLMERFDINKGIPGAALDRTKDIYKIPAPQAPAA